LRILVVDVPWLAEDGEIGIGEIVGIGILVGQVFFGSEDLGSATGNGFTGNGQGLQAFFCQGGAFFFVVAFLGVIDGVVIE